MDISDNNINQNIKNFFFNINKVFKIPILYLKKYYITDKNIINELELIKNINNNEKKENIIPIYYELFNPNNILSEILLEQMVSYYTKNIKFLKETQKLQTEINIDFSIINNEFNNYFNFNQNNQNSQNILQIYYNLKNETSFCEKYLFITINYFKFLNNNPLFLKLLCFNNILSPLLSLLFPIIYILIIFFILILKGKNLTFFEFLNILKFTLKNHLIGKILNQGIQKEPILFVYLFIYLYSTYQNFLICFKFFKNINNIVNNLNILNKYIKFSLKNMNFYYNLTQKYNSYIHFNQDLNNNIILLNKFQNKLDYLLSSYNNSFNFINLIKNTNNIGLLMQSFYEIFDNKELELNLLYSFGFNGYFNNLINLNLQINNQKLNKAKYFTKKNIKPKFESLYYPKFINKKIGNIQKNSINLNKNIILTGPNASGKTTLIKSILINLLLSQQFGFGCFKTLKFTPFSYFYSYINIPDTLDRDSLFQAEARRCKNILENINNKKFDNHFVIFDELFSGTNPEEAIISAFSYLKHINNKNNLSYILTTHFYKLCIDLKNNCNIKNYCMDVNIINNNLKFNYKVKKGINKIKGGLNVLKKLNFPKEIFS